MKIKRRRYIQFVLCLAAFIVVATTVLLNSPRVQQRVSVILATELENRIGTRVDLGGVHWLFPNDIVIDSLEIDDQEGEHLLSVDRVAAKVEWMPLIKHRQISIRNIRLFNPDIVVYQDTKDGEANFKFLVDAFANKQKKREPSKLNLRINSLLIRHANIRYDVHAMPVKSEFDPHHIAVNDLSAQLSLKAFTSDTLSVMVRQLEFVERSGLQVDNLYFRFVGNHQGATLANFHLDLPHSTLRLDTIWASYSPDKFTESLIVKGRTQSSHITPSDLAWMVPQVKGLNEKMHLSADFIGSATRFNIKDLGLYSHHKDLVLRAEGAASVRNKQIANAQVTLHEALLTPQVWNMLEEGAPEVYRLIPQEVVRVGNVDASGDVKCENGLANVNLSAKTDVGALNAHATMDREGNFTTSLTGTEVNVGQVVPSSPLAKLNLAFEAEGAYDFDAKDASFPVQGTFRGQAAKMHLLGYSYQHVAFDGHYNPQSVGCDIRLDDPNGRFQLQGRYTPSEVAPAYRLTLRADSLNFHAMNLIELHEDKHFSVRVHADGVGADVNHLTGFVSLDSLTIHKGDEDYIIQQIALYSTDPDEQMLSLSSDFMEGSVRGDFTYESLYQSVLSHLHRYLPSVCSDCAQGHKHADNICTANFKIHTLKPLQEFLLMPVEIQQAVNIEGFINDHTQDFRLQAIVPQIDFNGMSLSNIGVRCEPSGNGLDAYVSGTQHADDAVSTSVNLLAHAQDDRVNLGLSWETTPEALFDGAFYAKVAFDLDEKGDLVAQVQSDSSHTTINHSQWMLYPFKADIATENISIRDFRFEGGDQFLTIDGRIADNSADTLRVKVNNLDLNYLLTLVKLKGISFGGNVSGYVDLANLYSEAPYVDARIHAEDFAFCNGLMGDAIAHAYWNQDSTRLDFVADVSEVPQRVSKVNGYADLADRKLRIDIDADSINVLFLNGLLKNFMSDVKGNASGNIVIAGPMTELDIVEGALLTDAEFRLIPTCATYHFKDTLHFEPAHIYLRGIEAYDQRGQKGIVNGVVEHDDLRTFAYDLYVDAQNLLGIDLPDTGSDNFYTTIFGTGEVHVNGGPGKPLEVDIMAQPEKGSIFALNLVNPDVTSSESFITFRDRASKRNTPTVSTAPRGRTRRRPARPRESLELDIVTSITPDATLKLVMNQAVDDHISLTGSGDLQIDIKDTDINLYGTYTVEHGGYRLSLQDVINKDFEVLRGSTVTFDGDPMNSRLDIVARHVVNSVPLKDLTPDATGSVRVNCLLRIGGTLEAPELVFDLELPQGTEEEKAIVRSFTSTEEQMSMQFIYLLGVRKFYTMDLAQNPGINAVGGMENLLGNTISGQINNLLSGIISSDNWNLASNIRTENMMTGVGDPTMANMEVQGILEGRLLDNRLLINGNFGYRDNPMYASNFVGDFDIRYLLRSDLSLKGYNKTNDRYFTKTSLTTQGIGLLFQRDFSYLIPRGKKNDKAAKEAKREAKRAAKEARKAAKQRAD
ncbi:MAG: translocation/assembly module TamB domain-containing protein [Bacteroidaceae bacterium]|nr:translocation/assembly module TamB domain-containing protein [Bacteroidaceae bacterium]